MKERIQKIIASSGYCSRRKAEELIKSGKVFVNGKIIKIGDSAEKNSDKIEINGHLLRGQKKVYYALSKPVMFVVTKNDPQGRKTIYDLPAVKAIKEKVFPVGRLDFMSEGLLLLTNDGQWANEIAHPRYEIEKTYQVKVRPLIKPADIEKIKNGVIIDNRKTAEAKVKKINTDEIEITIHEGRNRIIRKIMDLLGYKVLRLKRIKIGKYILGNLNTGEIKEINV